MEESLEQSPNTQGQTYEEHSKSRHYPIDDKLVESLKQARRYQTHMKQHRKTILKYRPCPNIETLEESPNH